MSRNRNRRSVSVVRPVRPCNGQPGVLPMAVATHDLRLIARTIGPIEHTQNGTKWSPVSEVFETHGVFHG